MMNRYTVTVFEEKYDEDPDESNALSNVRWLAEVKMLARDEKEAAAKAYIRCVGLQRVQILENWKAPDFIVGMETDIGGLAAQVERCDTRLGQYKYDNKAQVWYFNVQPAEC